MSFNIHIIAGARPNFMKIAPLWHALSSQKWCTPKIIHTGQHYDVSMSGSFFEDLGMPTPQYALNVGSGSHAVQTANIMIAYEEICLKDTPDLVIVVGDVNSTIACALVTKKLGIILAHLEAGLRSGDRTMPEEINRLATDAISDVLWTPSPDANENLHNEGIPDEKVEFVGNIMIDSFEMQRNAIDAIQHDNIKFLPEAYAAVTLHRPSNVDGRENLQIILSSLLEVAKSIPLVFPLHPRTRGNLEKYGFLDQLNHDNIQLIDPMPYRSFMSLVKNSRLVITDSGGIQEETSHLGIPCLTLRDNTERPITISQGTNQLVKVENLIKCVSQCLTHHKSKSVANIKFWDGKTAQRIAENIQQRFDL